MASPGEQGDAGAQRADSGASGRDSGLPVQPFGRDAGAGDDPDATLDAGAPSSSPPAPPPSDGVDETLALFDGTHLYFSPDDRRQIDRDVELPADMFQYRGITLEFALRCPDGGCDAWDRHGHISIMTDVGGERRELELLRFVTPYRRDMTFALDVTDLRPLLTGRVTARVFIDTWVGPGNNSGPDAAGAGWLVDAHLRYLGGKPAREVLSVVPLWSPEGVVYGDPGRSSTREANVELPSGVSGARVWMNVTGHGQGNRDNCAEFCPAEHRLQVADQTFTRHIWRDDCASTAVPDQSGNWQPSRAGWCPGAGVVPWVEDVSSAVNGKTSLTVSWSPQPYENTCREGLPDDQCNGCVFSTPCRYDGGLHTEPHYQLSGMLVVYR